MASIILHIVLFSVSLALIFKDHEVSARNAMQCGTMNFVRPLISGETETVKGEWPFIVAIRKHSNYICGGTIISNRHILTAAHCIQQKNSQIALSPNDLKVRLGAHNLTDSNENGVIERNVSAVIIHPDWEPFEISFGADIAILVLSENLAFNNYIKPVCLPGNGITENMEGSVVGYGGRDDRAHSGIPRRIIVTAVGKQQCFRDDYAAATFSSERTFCGGNANGYLGLESSGSGYFATSGASWSQYGILAALRTNTTGHVIPHAYHLYTNVAMFTDWIFETVKQAGGVRSG